DGDDPATAFIGELAADPVMRLEVADDEAAAVEINEHRQWIGAGRDRGVDADRNFATRTRNPSVLDFADRNVLRADQLHHGDEHRAAFGGRKLEHLWSR